MEVLIFGANGWKMPIHIPENAHTIVWVCHLSHQLWQSGKQSDL